MAERRVGCVTINVLFICTGDSARSIMAEAILNRLGAGKFKAYSAGSQPKGDVHPGALMLLQVKGYNLTELRSKSWDGFIGADLLPVMPPFIGRVCSGYAPGRGVLQTPSV